MRAPHVLRRLARVVQARRRDDERGFVLVFFSIMLILMLALAGFVVDFGNWQLQGTKIQRAADAASLAGAVFMPDDFTSATARALEIANANGIPSGEVQVAQVPNHPDQLQVTITHAVKNYFAQVIGMRTKTITKTAIAEYQKPVAMGSPVSQFANDPESGKSPPSDAYPGFWASIAGGKTDKVQGDGYAAKVCNRDKEGGSVSKSDNCSSGTNTDYDSNGYYYTVHLDAGTGPVTVEAFDAAYVATGEYCDQNMNSAAGLSVGAIPGYPTPTGTKPTKRYSTSDLTYCPGDSGFESLSSSTADPFDTTFTTIGPATIPGDPASVKAPPICSMTFPGMAGDVASRLTNPADYLTKRCVGGTSLKFGAVFHAWYPIAQLTGPGDFFVQVQTPSNDGNGENKFALRACSSAAVGACNQMSGVTISGTAKMSLFANIGGGSGSTFYLARVLPGSGGRTLVVSLYDLADADTPGTFSISGPPSAGALSCQYTPPPGNSSGPPWGSFVNTSAGCTITGVQHTTYNGQWLQIRIPIPTSINNCQVNVPTDCWFKISFSFPSGVHDTTTWSAFLDGEPVRIVK
jgi:Flp pilus assembly protein TadG